MVFSCGLVSELSGYFSYLYPSLVDDSYHLATRNDPSLNFVGQTAYFVANPCAGTLDPWKTKHSDLSCTIRDEKQRTRRNIVRSAIRFADSGVSLI